MSFKIKKMQLQFLKLENRGYVLKNKCFFFDYVICKKMDELEIIMLNEISQTKKK
jgi:hypothetical protein